MDKKKSQMARLNVCTKMAYLWSNSVVLAYIEHTDTSTTSWGSNPHLLVRMGQLKLGPLQEKRFIAAAKSIGKCSVKCYYRPLRPIWVHKRLAVIPVIVSLHQRRYNIILNNTSFCSAFGRWCRPPLRLAPHFSSDKIFYKCHYWLTFSDTLHTFSNC